MHKRGSGSCDRERADEHSRALRVRVLGDEQLQRCRPPVQRRSPGRFSDQPWASVVIDVWRRRPPPSIAADPRHATPLAAEATISESLRVFDCPQCGVRSAICTRCDRGNRYCGPACSAAARRDNMLAAGRRYRRKPLGQRNGADRQKRYRNRQAAIVTHHGSPAELRAGEERPSTKDREVHFERNPMCRVIQHGEPIYECCFCGQRRSAFLRFDFRRRRRRPQEV